jgi:predicted nucleotidyltransferase
MNMKSAHSKQKKSKVLDQLVQTLKSYEPEKIYLFGSWARDEEDELSDMDVVVIKKTQDSFFSRLKEVAKLLPEHTAVDILVYTPDEFREMSERGNAFAEMIVEEGKLIYER